MSRRPVIAMAVAGPRTMLRHPIVLTVVLALTGRPVALPAQPAASFERWARVHAQPLPASDTLSGAGLEPFAAIVGKARVVAFGEPTHGAHEPLAFRNRLFAFLVERMGFTAVVLESGVTESYRLHQFANGGEGTVQEVVRAGVTWGMGAYPENEALLAWIRRYNADPSHRRKVQIYGMDLSGGDTDELPQARRAVDFAIAWLGQVDSELAARFTGRFRQYLDRFSSPGYPSLTAAERGALTRTLDELVAALERHRTDTDAFAWARQSAENARQLNRFFLLSPAVVPTMDRRGGNMSRASGVRDSSMAENLRWALAREGPRGRVLVYAHNNHIMNSRLTGGIWTGLHITSRVLGVNLRQRFGNDLVLIGSSAASANGGMPPMEADSTSLDDILARAGPAPFVVDLRTARADPATWAWLGRPRALHSATSHVAVVPRDAFDALVYLGSLSPVRP